MSLGYENLTDDRCIYTLYETGQKIASVQETIAEAFQFHMNALKAVVLSNAKEQSKGVDLRDKTEYTIEQQLKLVPVSCSQQACDKCFKATEAERKLFEFVERQPFENDTISTIEKYIKLLQDSNKRRLLQIFRAAIVQHGCCADFDNIIKDNLDKWLQHRKPGQFSDREQDDITDQIFSQLKNAAKSMDTNNETLYEKYSAELVAVYRGHPDIMQKFAQPVDFDKLFDQKSSRGVIRGIKQLSSKFNPWALDQEKVAAELKRTIAGIPKSILQQKQSECFEYGMVKLLSNAISSNLEKFCEQRLKLDPVVNIGIHMWLQQQFFREINILQQKWDKLHKPLAILEQNEMTYKNTIKTRLQLGYSAVSEAVVASDLIVSGAATKATNAISEQRFRTVK